MIREHESALIHSAKCISAADRKLDELAMEKVDMKQEHQNALINATSRVFSAEQKAHEYETIDLASKPRELVQIGLTSVPGEIPSPSAGKRLRYKDEQDASTQRQG
jgi:hypothetical protein